jgi:hypothetical protein
MTLDRFVPIDIDVELITVPVDDELFIVPDEVWNFIIIGVPISSTPSGRFWA